MTDTLNHRGAPMRGGDPLAELARIVNRDKPREEPFSDLFNEARRPDRPVVASGRPTAVPRPVDFGTDPRHDDDIDEADFDRDDRYELADEEPQTEPWTDEFFDEEPEPDGYEEAPPRKRGRGMAIAAALGVLVVVGGAVYAWQVGFGPGTATVAGRDPPVISASTNPSKIEVEPKSAEPVVAAKGGDKVVVREETPVALGEKAIGTPDSPRVVLPAPNGQAAAAPPPAAEPIIASAPAAVAPKPAAPIADASRPEPRRVRTVKVLADGTIVTGEAPAAPAEVPSLAQQVAPTNQPQVPDSAQTPAAPAATAADAGKVQDAIEAKLAEAVEPSMPSATDGVTPDPAVSVNKPAQAEPALSVATRAIELKDADPADAEATAPLPATVDTPPEPAAVEAVDLPPTRPEVPARVASADPAPAAVKPTVKKAPAEAAPIPTTSAASPNVQADTQIATASTPDATAPAPQAGGGGFMVQIAAAKSNGDAQDALKSMQRRYADVIGGKPSSIRKVDIEGKGTFYRVRIGPMATRDAATSLCVSLKAAGGDCVVARN